MNRLIIASSESPDMLYATRFSVPDPFIFLQKGEQTCCVLSDLEIDRGRRLAQVDEVIAQQRLVDACKEGGIENPGLAEVTLQLLKEKQVRSVVVPIDFPFGIAVVLQREGIQLDPGKELFWPEREFKSDEEIQKIEGALALTEAGIERGFEILRNSEIARGRYLKWSGKRLTSEVLRGEIDATITRLGGIPKDTIVASGEQGCDPHEHGSGPIKANELIILDVFPRDSRSGYFGDLTRTVVRGKASDAQRKLWDLVLEGQKLALEKIKPGVDGNSLHEEVKELFTERGYPTEQKDGRWTGFFHGTGHGLGLELHEFPRFSKTVFQKGQVMTVEPGLYYPGIGGVRHEDVITVTDTGVKILSNIEKPFEL